MNRREIICEIHAQHLECAINDYLTDWIREELDRTKKDRANYRACLKAINKLSKDKYIKALSEVE